MKKIFVLGSINTDMVISVPRMPDGGETVSGNGFFTNAGGKGANQAVACGKQSKNTYFIGNVGNDRFGKGLLKTLSGYGVDTCFTETADCSGGVAVVIVENGENRIILDGGANLKITRGQIDSALKFAEEGDALIVQLEINTDAVLYGLERAKRKNMITVLNAAPATVLPSEIYKNVDCLIVNESECAILSGIFSKNEADVKTAYGAIGCNGIKALIVTLGSRGSVCFDGNKIIKTAAYKVNVVDTTAAGDTFVGAFVCKLIEGEPLENCLKYASLCGALTCTKSGAQQSIPTLAEAEKFLSSLSQD